MRNKETAVPGAEMVKNETQDRLFELIPPMFIPKNPFKRLASLFRALNKK
jgi:hypothetical protein